jgi:hypothetical protein
MNTRNTNDDNSGPHSHVPLRGHQTIPTTFVGEGRQAYPAGVSTHGNTGHLPEPPAWLKLLTALIVAALAYYILGGGGVVASLLGSIGHTLTPLLETLWCRALCYLQRRQRRALPARQARALVLCGVVLAVAIGVPTGHWLNHASGAGGNPLPLLPAGR